MSFIQFSNPIVERLSLMTSRIFSWHRSATKNLISIKRVHDKKLMGERQSINCVPPITTGHSMRRTACFDPSLFPKVHIWLELHFILGTYVVRTCGSLLFVYLILLRSALLTNQICLRFAIYQFASLLIIWYYMNKFRYLWNSRLKWTIEYICICTYYISVEFWLHLQRLPF